MITGEVGNELLQINEIARKQSKRKKVPNEFKESSLDCDESSLVLIIGIESLFDYPLNFSKSTN